MTVKLGAGTSLPSILARKLGNLNKVYISDDFENYQRLKTIIEKSLEINNVSFNEDIASSKNIDLINIDWSNLDLSLMDKLPKIDFLIGSDVFFDEKSFFCFNFKKF